MPEVRSSTSQQDDLHTCDRWDDGPYSGAFKRVMTVSLLFVLTQRSNCRDVVFLHNECTINLDILFGIYNHQVSCWLHFTPGN